MFLVIAQKSLAMKGHAVNSYFSHFELTVSCDATSRRVYVLEQENRSVELRDLTSVIINISHSYGHGYSSLSKASQGNDSKSYLSSELLGMKNLKELHLENNKLDANAMKYLVPALCKMKNLQKLELRNNQPGTNVGKFITHLMNLQIGVELKTDFRSAAVQTLYFKQRFGNSPDLSVSF